MRIAIFDYVMISENAIGNCNRLITKHLSDEHHFTVFAVEYDNPDPEHIEFIKIPVIRRPLFILFITYHIMAPIIFWIYQRRNRVSFDIIQSVESNSILGNLIYSQFCHAAYLRKYWATTKPDGLRGYARWLDHLFHKWMEPIVYRKAKQVVVPSEGLKRELVESYPTLLQGKVYVISNPIQVDHMARPADFARQAQRNQLGLSKDDIVLIFVALGHFERKGLPLLMQAIQLLNKSYIKLLVVGGTPGLIDVYKQKAMEIGIESNMIFVGTHQDIRPYLWMADIFAFPSYYETFSLVCFEAAAAGLPLLVSHLHGVEDFLRPNVNGWLVERTPQTIADYIDRAETQPLKLKEMANSATEDVKSYNLSHFLDAWRLYYRSLNQDEQMTVD